MSKKLRTEISSHCLSTTALILLYLVIMPTVCAKGLPCSLELIDLVEDMLKDTDGMSAIEEGLYTPDGADYKQCPKSTLACFAEEVKVLMYHNPVLLRERHLFRRLMSINTRLFPAVCFKSSFCVTEEAGPSLIEPVPFCLTVSSHEEDSSRCPQCEANNIEPVEKFLSRLKYILQQTHAHGCGGQP